MELTAAEGRVLGCLVEREALAPDDYPVTLNALRLACNQPGRDPVVAFDDRTVEDALLSLKSKGLATFVAPGPAERTTRYRHRAAGRWRMGPGELAVLAVLLLHGVQSVPQVRERARRLARFTDPTEVDAVLDALAARTPTPFAARAPGPSTGAAGAQWAQVLTGPPPAPEVPREDPGADTGGSPSASPRAPAPSYADLAARLARVEQRLAAAPAAPATASAELDPSDPSAAPPHPPPPSDKGAGNQLAARVGDIERRLARIEAELAALR